MADQGAGEAPNEALEALEDAVPPVDIDAMVVLNLVLAQRSRPDIGVCTSNAMANLLQTPLACNRFALALLGCYESRDLQTNFQSLNDYVSGTIDSEMNPSFDRGMYILKVTGHIREYPDGRLYKTIYRDQLTTFNQCVVTHFFLQVGISIDHGNTRVVHLDAVRFLPNYEGGKYILILGTQGCRIAKLGNLASVRRIFFTEGGRAALRGFLEHEYRRNNPAVQVFLGEHWAYGLDDEAERMPLLLIPRMNLPMGNRTPFEVCESAEEVRDILLAEGLNARMDRTFGPGMRTVIQPIDLARPGNHVYDLSRNYDM